MSSIVWTLVPGLIAPVLELQLCAPLPGSATALEWSLSDVPAGLLDTHQNTHTVSYFCDFGLCWIWPLFLTYKPVPFYFFSTNKAARLVLCPLHCSVARASSSLLTMMVCWDVEVRLLRAGWSWLWRRSMWNFRWPLRLNLRYTYIMIVKQTLW